MKKTLLAANSTTTTILVIGFSLTTPIPWILILVAIAAGVTQYVADLRNWTRVYPFSLGIFIGLAALGVWQGAAPLLMLLGVIGAIVTWDLSRFSQRLSRVKMVEAGLLLQRNHARQLLIFGGLSLVLGSAALGLQISMSFGWTIFLGLLVVISLSWVVGALRRDGRN